MLRGLVYELVPKYLSLFLPFFVSPPPLSFSHPPFISLHLLFISHFIAYLPQVISFLHSLEYVLK